jgi:hypothetical protein
VANEREEVRTKRLVVLDSLDRERIVAEVVDGFAELRMDLPDTVSGSCTGVLIFAHSEQDDPELGSAIGVQLWAEGNAIIELTLWQSPSGAWVADFVGER